VKHVWFLWLTILEKDDGECGQKGQLHLAREESEERPAAHSENFGQNSRLAERQSFIYSWRAASGPRLEGAKKIMSSALVGTLFRKDRSTLLCRINSIVTVCARISKLAHQFSNCTHHLIKVTFKLLQIRETIRFLDIQSSFQTWNSRG